MMASIRNMTIAVGILLLFRTNGYYHKRRPVDNC